VGYGSSKNFLKILESVPLVSPPFRTYKSVNFTFKKIKKLNFACK